MPEINGKQVTFRTEISNREYWRLNPILAALEPLARSEASPKEIFRAIDYDDALALFTTLIESWDFEGDPSDPASYDALHPLMDMLPLFSEAMLAMGVITQELASSGESEGESI